ncbi:RluA family pseudouridine synthase [Sutcliffiella rhizosphaerae]|uniref:Pseudouridine synthase n=1 Tax=Sutcliffiella rhizosphaerae TaxID=2880967 RepID=A0ABM8YPE1_9BACI|nr:RluA family pseudouridine synthase [Sutcliffiella rhizosphaerae]CAG9621782.1 hypothetical protein BACCIP111883_02555 [Sutcliffiella rhizosphaerae]
MTSQSIDITVSGNHLPTLQDYLRQDILVSKKLLHEIRMSKLVTVNKEIPVWTQPLQQGDLISIPIFPENIEPSASNLAIQVLFENEHLLIINKSAGVETHPSSVEVQESLANGVAYYFKEKGIHAKVRHTHRLDKDTSGAILFAKHAISGAILDKLLEERKIKRTYIALVEGVMKKKEGTIDTPIGKDRHHATRRRVSPSGQKALTHYKVLKEFPNEKCSLLKITLDTGRTHQIRVHMSSIGHPLFGDKLYGATSNHHRHSLHAWELSVPHPFTNSIITTVAPLPVDFGPKFVQLTDYY